MVRLRENDEFLDLAYDVRLYNGTSRTLWGCTAVTTENCQHTTIHVIFTFGDTRLVIDLHMSTSKQILRRNSYYKEPAVTLFTRGSCLAMDKLAFSLFAQVTLTHC